MYAHISYYIHIYTHIYTYIYILIICVCMDVFTDVCISLQPAPKGGNGHKSPFGGNQSGGEKKPKFDSPMGGGKGKGKGKGKGSPGGGKGTRAVLGSACKPKPPS